VVLIFHFHFSIFSSIDVSLLQTIEDRTHFTLGDACRVNDTVQRGHHLMRVVVLDGFLVDLIAELLLVLNQESYITNADRRVLFGGVKLNLVGQLLELELVVVNIVILVIVKPLTKIRIEPRCLRLVGTVNGLIQVEL